MKNNCFKGFLKKIGRSFLADPYIILDIKDFLQVIF